MARAGDIVYLGSEGIYPHKVITVGYGTYEGQVRIARIDDNFHEWSTGFWTPASSLWVLEVGDSLTATAPIIEASEARLVIPLGIKCTYKGRDSDGDVLLCMSADFVGRKSVVVFAQDLLYLFMN